MAQRGKEAILLIVMKNTDYFNSYAEGSAWI